MFCISNTTLFHCGHARDYILFDVPAELVSLTEIATMLGVSRQRVSQLIETYKDFPRPEADLAVGRVWLKSRVQAWADSHPRRPGQPPRQL